MRRAGGRFGQSTEGNGREIRHRRRAGTEQHRDALRAIDGAAATHRNEAIDVIGTRERCPGVDRLDWCVWPRTVEYDHVVIERATDGAERRRPRHIRTAHDHRPANVLGIDLRGETLVHATDTIDHRP